jgi:predicted acetyltransferase
MRWAEPTEAEALSAFIARIAGSPNQPDEALHRTVYSMLAGEEHPTTRAADFLVVVDENEGGEIVSSTALISQIWIYAGIAFPVGQPEAVMTDPAYRRRGLVRKQFEVLHARSAARGELVQVISGIDWYYRQFGYAMALEYGGARRLYWPNLPLLGEGQSEIYRQRPATIKDIARLSQLYPFHCQQSLLNRKRDEASWRYELTRDDKEALSYKQFWLIENRNSNLVGYYQATLHEEVNLMVVTEVALRPEQSWREVAEFICRSLKAQADRWTEETKAYIWGISFELGTAHSLYEALGGQLEGQILPYAWYVRVSDLPAFLRKIAPVLEERMAHSPLASYTGQLRLNFYRSGLVLSFEAGQLRDIQAYQPEQPSDGDVMFHELTFLDVLFGRRSLGELHYIWPDCHATTETSALLINSLFPRQPSCILQLV